MQFLLDKICLEHNAGYGHPEQPLRVKSILNYFENKGLQNKITNTDSVSKESLQRILLTVHDENLIKRVKQSENKKETYFDQDTQANSKTYQAALKAASLAITAGQQTSVEKNLFSIMRPPGHHATPQRIMGFCFFNNMALATQNLLERKKKVAIIDFDFHYGNGTADIFWNNPDVLYISIHADPSVNFPNQGFIDEIGSKDGKGFNVCLPFTYFSGNNELYSSIEQIVLPLLGEFKPDTIGMSAGFDGFYNDPIGGGYLQYNTEGYTTIGTIFKKYSLETKTPIFHILEGGYNIQALPELVYSYCKPWLEDKQGKTKEFTLPKNYEVKSREQKTIEYVKQMLHPYWNLQ